MGLSDLTEARKRWLAELRRLLQALDDDDFLAAWKHVLLHGEPSAAEKQTFAEAAILRDRQKQERAMREALAATADLPRYHVIALSRYHEHGSAR
jgi:hypothetical protein